MPGTEATEAAPNLTEGNEQAEKETPAEGEETVSESETEAYKTDFVYEDERVIIKGRRIL